MKFINREKELEAIGRHLKGKNFELYIIYGRRRIGKTALSLKSVEKKDFIYYLASEEDNLRKFREVASQSFEPIKFVQLDWEAFFNFLKNKIIIIDEFPNLIKENSHIVSLFQRVVDTVLKDTSTKLILLGSSISMMESKILSYQAPLFGRRTGQLKLAPLKFFRIKDFFPRASWQELIEIYGFSDGIPYYLEKIKYPFWKWLDRELKSADTFLKTEIDFLMKYEFKETSTYKRILEALSWGRTKPAEIKQHLGVKNQEITPYLNSLMETEFIEKRVPLLARRKSRRARYYLKDNFLNFWFRFIYPNLTFIEEGIFSVSRIRREYLQYLGYIFEKIAQNFLIEKRRELPFKFTRIGSQWGRTLRGTPYEIDVVILNDREVAFFECKFKNLSLRQADFLLEELKKKVASTDIGKKLKRKFFGLIARKIEKKKLLRNKGFLIFDLRDFIFM